MPFPTADVPFDKDPNNPKTHTGPITATEVQAGQEAALAKANEDISKLEQHNKKILVLDFDGVINGYQSGWQGAGTVPADPPVPGVCEFIVAAAEHFKIMVHSSRSQYPHGIIAMRAYLMAAFQHYFKEAGKDESVAWNMAASFVYSKMEFPVNKPPAFLTIDDRALTFTGVWPSVEELASFKPWNKK